MSGTGDRVQPDRSEEGSAMRKRRFNAKAHRLAALRADGWAIAEDVERRLASGHVTQDFLGFGDIILYHPRRGWWLEQVTVESALERHLKAAMANGKVEHWKVMGFGARIVVYPNRADREEGDMEPRVVVV